MSTDVAEGDTNNTSQPKSSQDSLSILLITIEPAGHSIPMLSLGEALLEKGHKVTMLAVETKLPESSSTMTNLKTWCWERNIPFVSAGVVTMELQTKPEDFVDSWAKIISGKIVKLISFLKLIPEIQKLVFNALLENEQQLLQSSDVVVLDLYFSSTIKWLNENTDLIVFSFTQTIPYNSNALPSWYYPTFPVNPSAPANPSIMDRLLSVLASGAMTVVMNTAGRSVRDAYPFYSPSGARNPDIVATSFGFDYPRPLYPLTHYVGPVVSNRKQPLEENLKHWLDSHSPQSVVYLSMGSYMPLDGNLARGIVHGVMETGYDLLWSLKNSYHEILQEVEQSYLNSSRVVISDWLPQAAALNHPAIAMAVLHGGSGGVNEALLAGVPIICLPQAADQPTNCARVKYQGLGENFGVVDDLTVSEVKQAIHYIKEHDCREKANKVSKIFRQAGGASKAVELIEYYHEMGYDHLVPSWAKYNWTFIQYYNLDVYVLLGVVVSLLILLLWKLGKLCKRSMHKTVKID
jgi:glucuronosyltransferase